MIGFKRINFKQHFSSDLLAGFVIFLIALPLSIGIAIASGAPASAGIIAAVIGGVIGSLFGGSQLTINGPAAGMIVVVLGAIQSLSDSDPTTGFRRFLAVVVVVGVLQIVSGIARIGNFVLLCPTPVIHGMMSAIGCIIMVKQLPVLVGVKPANGSVVGIIRDIPSILGAMDLPIALLGFACLGILLAWNKMPAKLTKFLPGPLVVVSVGLAVSYLMRFDFPHVIDLLDHMYQVGPEFLVSMPQDVSGFVVTPLFDDILSTRSFAAIVAIYLVGSLESQLSTLAVDKLDPERRTSNFDQEFIGKGLVNLLCGFLGGLPVISEIVRSSANIANGAKSPLSNFFHGAILLVFAVAFPSILVHIPLTALAAILLLVGWRLGHPKHIKAVWRHGKAPFAIFMTTLVLTLVEDLLIGIAAGFALNIVIGLVSGVKFNEFVTPNMNVDYKQDSAHIKINGALMFSSFLALQNVILNFREVRTVVLDMHSASYIDHTVAENLRDLEQTFGRTGRKLEMNWPQGGH